MSGYSVIYDIIKSGIRIVKLQIDRFNVTIMQNPKLNTLHVEFKQPDFFGPDLQYLDGKFTMTYNYIVIPQDNQDDFMKAYENTLTFCRDAKPIIDDLVDRIEKGEGL